ncbi:IclR family transcriptional regulator [Cellulomonas dongxiuzhuiae]|uniref:IclR family transcriptional regulator n=1 Tax=Cellulomonas dongxiuzhuiae TaxID=2819979 RepID=UPI001AAE5EF4|nr:IclR family transcriptional regulator [Cellulomonas dongxiuzhuiae]MBO3088260.1 IclR family transcriptional regulator [Cellulomonas dongxiuzhuiae]
MSQSVARAAHVLRLVAERPQSLSEIATALDVHKSTALRMLQTLVAEGFARQGSDGLYVLGFGLIALVGNSLDRMEVRSVARPHLTALVDQYGHTVHLAQLVDDEIRYVDKIDGRGPVSMGSRVGATVDLHTAGVAKAILASVDDATRRRLERHITFQRYTSTTIVTPERLGEELAVTRARGWAEDDGEKEDYINCVALPIFDGRGQVCASMSITALRAVASLDDLRRLVPAFRQVSESISRELGWRA